MYWFRRALVAAVLLLLLWASSFLAGKLHWSLSPEGPAAGLPQSEPAYVIVDDTPAGGSGSSTRSTQSEPAYVIVDDTALRVSSGGR